MGPLGGYLGPLLASFRPPWGLLGPSWGHLGAIRRKSFKYHIYLKPSWALWGRSWALSGPSWAHLGAILGPSGASRGSPGPFPGSFPLPLGLYLVSSTSPELFKNTYFHYVFESVCFSTFPRLSSSTAAQEPGNTGRRSIAVGVFNPPPRVRRHGAGRLDCTQSRINRLDRPASPLFFQKVQQTCLLIFALRRPKIAQDRLKFAPRSLFNRT